MAEGKVCDSGKAVACTRTGAAAAGAGGAASRRRKQLALVDMSSGSRCADRICGRYPAVEVCVRRLPAIRDNQSNRWQVAVASGVWSPGTIERRRDVRGVRRETLARARSRRRRRGLSSGCGGARASTSNDSRDGSGRGAGGPSRKA